MIRNSPLKMEIAERVMREDRDRGLDDHRFPRSDRIVGRFQPDKQIRIILGGEDILQGAQHLRQRLCAKLGRSTRAGREARQANLPSRGPLHFTVCSVAGVLHA